MHVPPMRIAMAGKKNKDKIASVIKLNKHLDFCIKILPCTQHNHKGPSCFLPCPARVLLLGNNKQLMLYKAQLFS